MKCEVLGENFLCMNQHPQKHFALVTRVSNESLRSQLSHDMMIVDVGLKLWAPYTKI